MREKDMTDGIIEEIGDISGWNVLDIGSGPCTMVACLARRIGDGRVFAADLYMGLQDTLKKTLTRKQLLRTNVLKADLRRLDFLKDDFFDLVTAYDTLSVIDEYTPGGTPYVLYEAQRTLKPEGWFIAVEHWPLDTIRPADKAQEAELRWWRIHLQIAKALGEATGVEYTPTTLHKTLSKVGLTVTRWKPIEHEKTEAGIKFGSKIISKAERIRDESIKARTFEEMRSIEKDANKYGMRELPHFAVYTRNPKQKRLKKPRELSLKQLYKTVRRSDLLF